MVQVLACHLMRVTGMAREDRSGVERFVRSLKEYPVLDRVEEERLAVLYRATHDAEAARKLVEGHLRLVVKIARACCFQQSALPDLIQEGTLGLMKAVTKCQWVYLEKSPSPPLEWKRCR